MNKSERFTCILNLLKRDRYLNIDEMTKSLFVSPSTLRRDLAEMSRIGYLVRTRGGAMALEPSDQEDNIIHFKEFTFSLSQIAIAKKAAELVRDGDRIFMDASSTCLCMAQYLSSKKGLTIVTNNLLLILALPERKQHIICCGGGLNTRNMSVTGRLTAASAARFNYHIAFFNCAGATCDDVTTTTVETAAVLAAVCKHAQETVLLCPHEKFGRVAPVNALRTEQLSTIITDTRNAFCHHACRVLEVANEGNAKCEHSAE